MQRMAHAEAIGSDPAGNGRSDQRPFEREMVDDIVGLVAITACQAEEMKYNLKVNIKGYKLMKNPA